MVWCREGQGPVWNNKKKCVFHKLSRFVSVILIAFLGPPRLALHNGVLHYEKVLTWHLTFSGAYWFKTDSGDFSKMLSNFENLKKSGFLFNFLYGCIFSSRGNARGELRVLEGCRVSSKTPLMVLDGDEGVAWRNEREIYSPDKGWLICPLGKSMIFFAYRVSLIFNFLRPPGLEHVTYF